MNFFIAPRWFFHRDRDVFFIAIAMKKISRRDEKIYRGAMKKYIAGRDNDQTRLNENDRWDK